GAAAQYIAWAHQDGIADAARDFTGLFYAGGGAVGGARNGETVEQLAEELAVFGEIDIGGVGADDGDAQALERQRQVERSLAAELHDDAVGLLGVADVEDVFERERLEVEAVAGVVVGGDGLGVAVDHDRLDAHFLQRERRVAAAVIELDPLPDTVGTAAQDHDLFAGGGVGFARSFVVGIEVGREAFEFGGAG